MPESIERSKGRPSNYKQDRGGVPAEFGHFYGVVKNTTDSIRSGRIQVYIEAFSNGGENEPSKWITVSYMPQFFGSTPYNPAKTGIGSYIDGNSNSYGMWFTPPDVGITVLCVFVNGDRSQGFSIVAVSSTQFFCKVHRITHRSAVTTRNDFSPVSNCLAHPLNCLLNFLEIFFGLELFEH
jgi:hypothetical protein